VVHRGSACDEAAVESLLTILTQPADSWKTARAIRHEARLRNGCHIADDSLRKREEPVIDSVASLLHRELSDDQVNDLPSRQSIMDVLRPYAELAGEAVAVAAKLFSQRAALASDDTLYSAIAAAIWSVAQFGVLPVYALQRLEAMGLQDVSDDALAYILEAIIQVPSKAQPGDLDQLATAIQLREQPERFYDRLLVTPVMRPVVERFVTWLASHDPASCLVDSNDVIVGYCGPHYYAAMCESFVMAADDYASGEFAADLSQMLEGLGLAERSRQKRNTSRD
jgi:hypothetical protein